MDEAECISSWSEAGFRPAYAMAGNLRRILPPETPVLAATAMANSAVQKSIKEVLGFGDNSHTENLGNYRPNIIHEVHRLAGAEKAVGEINQYFPSKTELPIALIFVDSRPLGQTVLHSLRNYVDPSVRGQIQIYHSYRSNFAKRVLTEGFKKEVVRVLGADFRRVSLVLNFLAPDSVKTWEQRAGRGARDKSIICRSIMMVQPALIQTSTEFDASAVHDRPEASIQQNDGVEPPAQEHTNDDQVAPSTDKANSRKRTHTKALVDYINHEGCRN
ncbi:hypothetical protein FRC06_010452, partial [Ceratobasidium sp. 370]